MIKMAIQMVYAIVKSLAHQQLGDRELFTSQTVMIIISLSINRNKAQTYNILVEFIKTSILHCLKVIFVVTVSGGFVTENLFQRLLLKVAINVAIKRKE